MKLRFPRIKIGLFSILFLIFLTAGLILGTPLGEIVIRLMPQTAHLAIFKNIYQEKTLIEKPGNIEKELRITKTLNVLGMKTGVCFEFQAGGTTIGQKENAEKGEVIADVVAVGEKLQSYKLDYVEVTKNREKNTLICQQFSRVYSTAENKIVMVIIKPKQPFTPKRVFWVSVNDMFGGTRL